MFRIQKESLLVVGTVALGSYLSYYFVRKNRRNNNWYQSQKKPKSIELSQLYHRYFWQYYGYPIHFVAGLLTCLYEPEKLHKFFRQIHLCNFHNFLFFHLKCVKLGIVNLALNQVYLLEYLRDSNHFFHFKIFLYSWYLTHLAYLTYFTFKMKQMNINKIKKQDIQEKYGQKQIQDMKKSFSIASCSTQESLYNSQQKEIFLNTVFN